MPYLIEFSNGLTRELPESLVSQSETLKDFYFEFPDQKFLIPQMDNDKEYNTLVDYLIFPYKLLHLDARIDILTYAKIADFLGIKSSYFLDVIKEGLKLNLYNYNCLLLTYHYNLGFLEMLKKYLFVYDGSRYKRVNNMNSELFDILYSVEDGNWHDSNNLIVKASILPNVDYVANIFQDFYLFDQNSFLVPYKPPEPRPIEDFVSHKANQYFLPKCCINFEWNNVWFVYPIGDMIAKIKMERGNNDMLVFAPDMLVLAPDAKTDEIYLVSVPVYIKLTKSNFYIHV